MNSTDPRDMIAHSPMSRAQIIAVSICIFLNALDGFDVLAITFASPGLQRNWGISSEALGWLISAGFIGMTIGSLTLAPIADMIGRRWMILTCLTIMATGMLASAFVNSYEALFALRVVTGLGIGGMIPPIQSMASEFANERNRDLSVSLMAVGYPIGGVVGGSVAAWLLAHFQWTSIFLFGAAITGLIIPIVYFAMPESIEFLMAKKSPDCLVRVNAVLKRLQFAPLGTLPEHREASKPTRVTDIFSHKLWSRTVLLTSAYGALMVTFIFLVGWIPATIAALGYSQSQASIVSVLLNIGGIVGGILLGLATRNRALRPLVILTMLLSSAAIIWLGYSLTNLVSIQIFSVIAGFFIYAAAVGLYAVMARAFPVQVRSTGTGFAIGIGRTGGSLGLVLAGMMIDMGCHRSMIFAVMSFGALLAAASIAALPSQAIGRRESVPAE